MKNWHCAYVRKCFGHSCNKRRIRRRSPIYPIHPRTKKRYNRITWPLHTSYAMGPKPFGHNFVFILSSKIGHKFLLWTAILNWFVDHKTIWNETNNQPYWLVVKSSQRDDQIKMRLRNDFGFVVHTALVHNIIILMQ